MVTKMVVDIDEIGRKFADDIQKEKAESIIRDLRAQLRAAEIELKEVTISRDMYQRENGELKKQVTSLLNKIKKLKK